MVKFPKILVLDGHDGAGKTTLAQALAAKIDGKYVKPFNDSLGDMIAWLYKKKNYELTDIVSRTAIEKIYDENKEVNCLIFDRHWLSMFTVLPEKYFKNWGNLPKTFLCWADMETTHKRLIDRGEKILKDDNHQYYCYLYKKLAQEYGVTIIDTTKNTVEESLEIILSNIE